MLLRESVTFPFSGAFSVNTVTTISAVNIITTSRPTRTLAMAHAAATPPMIGAKSRAIPLGFSSGIGANDFPTALNPISGPIALDAATNKPPNRKPEVGKNILRLHNGTDPSIAFRFSSCLTCFDVRFLGFKSSPGPIVRLFHSGTSMTTFADTRLLNLANSNGCFGFDRGTISSHFGQIIVTNAGIAISGTTCQIPAPTLLPNLMNVNITTLHGHGTRTRRST